MRGEPPHIIPDLPFMKPKTTTITLRPYYNGESWKWWKMSLYQNDQNQENAKMYKSQNDQKVKINKTENSILPLRPENAIPYRGRGTPHKRQNPKNAGPGGSEITKCRFCPFIWHFDLFWGFLKMSLFSLFHFHFFTFSCFCVFLFCWFCHFLTFSLFPVFLFWWILINFYDFSCWWLILITFCV